MFHHRVDKTAGMEFNETQYFKIHHTFIFYHTSSKKETLINMANIDHHGEFVKGISEGGIRVRLELIARLWPPPRRRYSSSFSITFSWAFRRQTFSWAFHHQIYPRRHHPSFRLLV